MIKFVRKFKVLGISENVILENRDEIVEWISASPLIRAGYQYVEIFVPIILEENL